MNKRILSLVLVLCMILVSVPVLALPMSAAGNDTKIYKYTASFNSETISGAATPGSTSGWAPWFAGYYTVSKGYTNPDNFTKYSWAGTSGNFNQLLAGGSNSFINYGNVNANYYYPIGAVGANSGESSAIRYVAEKAGTVDIMFDKLGNVAKLVSGTFRYAIYVDGVKVWPAGDDWYTITKTSGAENVVYNEATVVATGITVEAGSKIDFICATDNAAGSGTTWNNGGNVMFATVAYTKVNPTHTTYFTGNLPTMNGSAPAFHGGWSFVGYTPGEANYANYKTVNAPSGWAGGLSGFSNLATTSMGATGGWYSVDCTQPNYQAAAGTVGASTAESMAIRYTAEYTGTANIAFEKLGNMANLAAGQFTYFIYKNGEKIWPLNGENNTVTGKAMIYTTKTEVVANLSLNAGDIIDFICEGASGRNMWGNGGNAMFGIVDYTSMEAPAAYSTSYNDNSNVPTLVDTDKVAFHGNWKVMTTRKDVGTYNSDLIPMSWAGTGGNYPGLATSGGAGFVAYNTTNGNYHGKLGTVGACATQATVVRYTAEKNGVATVSFDLLGNVAAKASGTFTYTVYLNGEKIWPLNGETNSVTNMGTLIDSKTAIASNLTLAIGDTIDFVCESEAAANLWGNGGNAMFATIDYTEFMPEATASATVSVGATVNATAKVTMPAEVYFPAEVGMYIDGVKTANTTAAILANVAIKDIETTSVKVQPYYTTTQGAEILGAEYTVTIADLLLKVGGTKAAAVLNYAAAAQKYFSVAGTLAFSGATVTGTYTDNLAIVEALDDARVTPQQVALILEDSVSFKFTVDGAEDGDVMMITDGENVATVAIENGVVTIGDVGIDNWNTTYTFQVLDEGGNAVSSSFTYSVSTYYARMANKADQNLTDLVTAMMALYETL